MVGIPGRSPEYPVTDRDADCVEAMCGDPFKVSLRDPCIPMFTQPPRRLLPSELDAEARFVPAGHVPEQAFLHPSFEYEPSAEVHAMNAYCALVTGNGRFSCSFHVEVHQVFQEQDELIANWGLIGNPDVIDEHFVWELRVIYIKSGSVAADCDIQDQKEWLVKSVRSPGIVCNGHFIVFEAIDIR